MDLSFSSAGRAARAIAARLRDAGFSAYLAGGCVRDLLLGQAPKDFDVATNARPEQIVGMFAKYGLRWGRILG